MVVGRRGLTYRLVEGSGYTEWFDNLHIRVLDPILCPFKPSIAFCASCAVENRTNLEGRYGSD